MFSIRIFSIKWRNLFALPLAFPFGESGGEAADRGLFKISPYVAVSPCLKKFSKLHFSAKIVRLQSLPLGGKVDKAKLWTNEGRNLFSIRIFSIKWRNLLRPSFAFSFGLNLAELPFNAIPASRVARSAEIGLFKISPYVTASPCLKKIQRTSFFSAKMGSLSLRQGFPLLLFAIAKISKNCQPLRGFPSGGGSAERRW